MATIATSVDGVSRKLVYNECIMLADRKDSLEFDVKTLFNPEISFKVKLRFSDEGQQYSSWVNVTDNPNVISITLNKWYAPTFVDSSEPVRVNIRDLATWLIALRTQSTEEQNLRF